MFTRDVRVEGYTAAEWTRLIELFRGWFGGVSAGDRRGGVIAITTGQRLRKLVSTERGRLDPVAEPWPGALDVLAGRHGASWAVELHAGTLEEFSDRSGERMRPEHDYLAQLIVMYGVFRELVFERKIQYWPDSGKPLRAPSERMLDRALDSVCHEGKVLLLGVFDKGELSTSLALRRSEHGFDWIVGPQELRRDMGLISGDWTRDYRHLQRATQLRVGPLSLGLYGELRTFRKLASESEPGRWASAVASRDIVVSPVVPAIALPLGLDLGRFAWASVQHLAGRVAAPLRRLEPLAELRRLLEKDD